ncbi:hypothetical protein LJR289_003521 [Pseudoduganella sp. LjRoot289]|uniref:hypothetical protein n=1 Tax=Pseudoduganella sp. LjRoot289 TaxID=3342314 RepID=UPI003ECD5E8F
MQSISHPSKEQVRAYMMQRHHARLPPPSPDEIRRQLGWDSQSYNGETGSLVFPSPRFALFLPGSMAQLSALMTVEWLFMAAGFSRSY